MYITDAVSYTVSKYVMEAVLVIKRLLDVKLVAIKTSFGKPIVILPPKVPSTSTSFNVPTIEALNEAVAAPIAPEMSDSI